MTASPSPRPETKPGMSGGDSGDGQQPPAQDAAEATVDRTTSSPTQFGRTVIGRGLRAVGAVSGIGLIAAAAVLFVAPGSVASILPIETVVETPVFSNAALRAAVLLAVGIGCVVWINWTTPPWSTTESEAGGGTSAPPDFETLQTNPPETATDTRVVGAVFDTTLDMETGGVSSERSDDAREQLRSLVIEGLVTVEGCSPDAARSQLDDGTWTEDAVAAAYLADREASLSFRRRLAAWLRPAQTRARRIERTADVVAGTFDRRSAGGHDDGEG